MYTANNLRILIDLIEVCIRLNNLLDRSLLGNGLIQLLYQPKIKFDSGKIHASIILQGEIKQYFCLVCIYKPVSRLCFHMCIESVKLTGLYSS